MDIALQFKWRNTRPGDKCCTCMGQIRIGLHGSELRLIILYERSETRWGGGGGVVNLV